MGADSVGPHHALRPMLRLACRVSVIRVQAVCGREEFRGQPGTVR